MPRGKRITTLAFALATSVLLAACSSSGGTEAGGDPTTTAGSPGASGTSGTSAAPGTTAATRSAIAPAATVPDGPCTMPADAATGALTPASLESDGLTREYLEYIPTTLPAGERVPLVVDIHGYSEGMGVHAAHTALDKTAEQHGFVALFPDGTGTPRFWNSPDNPQGEADLLFISTLIDEAITTRCVDPTRVYVTGLSNGALMTSRVGCDLADRVAAIAPVAGLVHDESCSPSQPMPIIAFQGGEDTFIQLEGDIGPDALELPGVEQLLELNDGLELPPIRDSAAAFAADNGCADAPVVTEPVAGVELSTWADCAEGSEVQLYVTQATGHVWPGSAFEATISSVTGTPNDLLDANELMWAFFERFQLES